MPFARHVSGKIINIADANRGDNCQCTCLGCDTPVTARKGEQREKHFAHQTKDSRLTTKKCSYSPATAIALLLRQELPNFGMLRIEGDFQFVNSWELETGTPPVDAIARLSNQQSVAFHLPFPGSTNSQLEHYYHHDYLFELDSSAIADSLCLKAIASGAQFREVLVKNFDSWATVLKPVVKQEEISEPTPVVRPLNEPVQFEPPAHETARSIPPSDAQMCQCCGQRPGERAKGAFCYECVKEHVGTTYISIAAMYQSLVGKIT
ncbi:hypothetical protein ECB94_04060 [Vibrio mediterranei]|uniref:Competence protein CoiA-like N-terminal domain-containing protein n=2 Tax=Vibrio mediterranei TaxID=689 RepID=A0A3G4V6W0_9VIBR|nr:hypothetical protein ECB94_04060 [Vibrio mediterranei]